MEGHGIYNYTAFESRIGATEGTEAALLQLLVVLEIVLLDTRKGKAVFRHHFAGGALKVTVLRKSDGVVDFEQTPNALKRKDPLIDNHRLACPLGTCRPKQSPPQILNSPTPLMLRPPLIRRPRPDGARASPFIADPTRLSRPLLPPPLSPAPPRLLPPLRVFGRVFPRPPIPGPPRSPLP